MRALIIDDARAMRSILKRIVQPLGFEVHEAANGREALDHLLATDHLPELALVDWNMPEMNGYDFIKAVRADRRFRGMSLMMVTTESEHHQVVRALAAGAHEYVIKPFQSETIIEKLNLLGLLPARAAA
ncbi:response regulator [Planosporangium thailandense]|uniref:Response regulator n=1 Tax=Planosporangium thailandense TaxID=765197 RepID=A0ABX0Y7M5_9ACTN|nr:response regulator [Planosporangium thailandense]